MKRWFQRSFYVILYLRYTIKDVRASNVKKGSVSMNNRKLTVHKGLVKILLFVMITAAALVSQNFYSSAASKKTEALKAYNRLLSKKNLKWKKGMKLPASRLKFSVIYLDKNSVPELFVDASGAGTNHVSGSYRLYTYQNGKVQEVGTYRDSFGYYKKKGVFVTTTYLHGEYVSYHKFSKAKDTIKLRSETYYDTAYYDEADRVIKKSTFNKQVKKLTGNKKRTAPVCYSNTAANREKLLK